MLPVQPRCSLTSGEPFSALCSCSTSPLFFGFFCLRRLRGGSPRRPPSRPHTTNSGVFCVVMEHFSLPGRLLYTQQGLLRCLLLEHCCALCKQRWDLCVCSHFVVRDLALKAHRRRLKKTTKKKLDSAQKQRAEQTQVRDLEWKLFQDGAPSAFTLES